MKQSAVFWIVMIFSVMVYKYFYKISIFFSEFGDIYFINFKFFYTFISSLKFFYAG